MIDIFLCPRFQEPLRVLGCKRDRLKIGTSRTGTVHGIMNPAVPPNGPQNMELDIIKRKAFVSPP